MRSPDQKAIQDGVIYLSPVNTYSAFEDKYLSVRRKEQRLLDDDRVRRLPYLNKNRSVHFKEWRIRAHSFERLRNYLKKMDHQASLLDLGCGNGWLAARLAENKLIDVSALDINAEELKQGARVFHHPNLAFYYGDIFEDIFQSKSFDFIVLNACAQYFDDLAKLVDKLFFFLKEGSEIHIIDTPFYKREEIEAAKRRTQIYYESIGFPETADFYHHHSLDDLLPKYNGEVLNHRSFFYTMNALVTRKTPSYFPWIRIVKKGK